MEPITTDEEQRMAQDARRFTGAFTGTSGTLAAHVLRLLEERRQLLQDLAVERARRVDS